MTKEMVELEVDRVDAVDRPANKIPFLLLKRDGSAGEATASRETKEEANVAEPTLDEKRSVFKTIASWLGVGDLVQDPVSELLEKAASDGLDALSEGERARLAEAVAGPEDNEQEEVAMSDETKDAQVETEASTEIEAEANADAEVTTDDEGTDETEVDVAKAITELVSKVTDLADRVDERLDGVDEKVDEVTDKVDGLSTRVDEVEKARGKSRVNKGQESTTAAAGSKFSGVLNLKGAV